MMAKLHMTLHPLALISKTNAPANVGREAKAFTIPNCERFCERFIEPNSQIRQPHPNSPLPLEEVRPWSEAKVDGVREIEHILLGGSSYSPSFRSKRKWTG